jgi:hypothetical protein
VELVQAAQEAADKGLTAYGEWWKSITKEQRKLLAGQHDDMKRRAEEADAARTIEAQPVEQE